MPEPTTVNCDPQALLAAAQSFCCIPKGLENQVMIYLLNTISGLNLNAQQLIDASRTYCCIPPGLQQEVIIFLLCSIANAEAA